MRGRLICFMFSNYCHPIFVELFTSNVVSYLSRKNDHHHQERCLNDALNEHEPFLIYAGTYKVLDLFRKFLWVLYYCPSIEDILILVHHVSHHPINKHSSNEYEDQEVMISIFQVLKLTI
jgi:hypothetical protein